MDTCRAVTALLVLLLLAGCGGPGDEPAYAAPPPSGETADALGLQGGDLDGARVGVDADVAAVTGLDPALLDALRRAAAAAREDGIEVEVTSGWRSRAFQQQLLDEAVARYGSAEEAARWVATPDTSAHVPGDAVDVGPTDAAYWMSLHGPSFGLCQVYANEIWHYELLAGPDKACPPLLADNAS